MSQLNTVLIVGNGGRESAIIDTIVKSTDVGKVYTLDNKYFDLPLFNIPDYRKIQNIEIENISVANIVQFSVDNSVNLVIVGSEVYLSQGIVDSCLLKGIPCFGPMMDMALIETSKIYAKEIMAKLGLPTADYKTFNTFKDASTFLSSPPKQRQECYHVLKADGLAAGKGVHVIPDNEWPIGQKQIDEGNTFLKSLFDKNPNGKVLLEKRLYGDEVSVLAFCDGYNVTLMPPARDFKRIYDGDSGPNTGGMGAICSWDLLTKEQLSKVQAYMEKVVRHLKYIGVLYAGLMIYNGTSQDEISFLEFNCRFGDPETQSILAVLDTEKSDLYQIMSICANSYFNGKCGRGGAGNNLTDINIRWKENQCSVNVVLSHLDYPESKLSKPTPVTFQAKLLDMYSSNNNSTNSSNNNNMNLLMANVSIARKTNIDEVCYIYHTTGGRVMNAVAVGDNMIECIQKAYQICELVNYKNKYYRYDIGKKYIMNNGFNYIDQVKKKTYKIPTIAFIIEEMENMKMVRNFIQHLDTCKRYFKCPIKMMGKLIYAKVGLIICSNHFIPKLVDDNTLRKIPILTDNQLQYKRSSYLVNILQSYNIDMVVTDLREDYNNLLKEYGVNWIYMIHSVQTKTEQDNIYKQYKQCKQYKLYGGEQLLLQNQNKDMCHSLQSCTTTYYELSRLLQEYIYLYNRQSLTYEVDIEKGNEFVESLSNTTSISTKDFCSFHNYNCLSDNDKNYIFTTSTDGIGTKLDLALKYNKLDDIGIDLVAMCVNDMYVHGAVPHTFLDYIAIDKMDVHKCKRIVESIKLGCEIADKCSLSGGETAEMRGIYRHNKCDIAGFALGQIKNMKGEKRCLYDLQLPLRHKMQEDDVIFGLPSSGIHSNGFTLINKILQQIILYDELVTSQKHYNSKKFIPIEQTHKFKELVTDLLTPTTIYSNILDLLNDDCQQIDSLQRGSILGMAHITGGGFRDNISRILPKHLTYQWNMSMCKNGECWWNYLSKKNEYGKERVNPKVIELYKWVQEKANMSINQMMKTFNCGIGIVVVVKGTLREIDHYKKLYNKYGLIELGKLVKKEGHVY